MRQLFIDSRDRVNDGGTSADFRILLPQTLVLENTQQLRVDHFRLPITIGTINSSNDQVLLTYQGVDHTIQIPRSNYDGPSLAATLQAALAAAAGSWTVTYNINLISLTVAGDTTDYNLAGSFFQKAFTRNYEVVSIPGSKIYSFKYWPVQGLDLVYLCSPNFQTLDTYGPSGSHDILLAIPITSPFGSVQVSSQPEVVWHDVPSLTTSMLSFQVRDRDYNILSDIPNVSFTISID